MLFSSIWVLVVVVVAVHDVIPFSSSRPLLVAVHDVIPLLELPSDVTLIPEGKSKDSLLT